MNTPLPPIPPIGSPKEAQQSKNAEKVIGKTYLPPIQGPKEAVINKPVQDRLPRSKPYKVLGTLKGDIKNIIQRCKTLNRLIDNFLTDKAKGRSRTLPPSSKDIVVSTIIAHTKLDPSVFSFSSPSNEQLAGGRDFQNTVKKAITNIHKTMTKTELKPIKNAIDSLKESNKGGFNNIFNPLTELQTLCEHILKQKNLQLAPTTATQLLSSLNAVYSAFNKIWEPTTIIRRSIGRRETTAMAIIEERVAKTYSSLPDIKEALKEIGLKINEINSCLAQQRRNAIDPSHVQAKQTLLHSPDSRRLCVPPQPHPPAQPTRAKDQKGGRTGKRV